MTTPDQRRKQALEDFVRACSTGDSGDISAETYRFICEALKHTPTQPEEMKEELLKEFIFKHSMLSMRGASTLIMAFIKNGIRIIPSKSEGEEG